MKRSTAKLCDWLVGGFYANEKLTVRDNLQFGAQYGHFASCRTISRSRALADALFADVAGCVARPAAPSARLPRRSTLRSVSSTSATRVVLTTATGRTIPTGRFSPAISSTSPAKLDLTLGVRAPTTGKFATAFTSDNQACVNVQNLVGSFLSVTALQPVSAG